MAAAHHRRAPPRTTDAHRRAPTRTVEVTVAPHNAVPAALWQGDVQSSVPLASSKLAWTARCVDASVKRQ